MPYPDLSFADVSSAVVRQVSSLDKLFIYGNTLPYHVCLYVAHDTYMNFVFLHRIYDQIFRDVVQAPWQISCGNAGMRIQTSVQKWKRWWGCLKHLILAKVVVWYLKIRVQVAFVLPQPVVPNPWTQHNIILLRVQEIISSTATGNWYFMVLPVHSSISFPYGQNIVKTKEGNCILFFKFLAKGAISLLLTYCI